MEYKIPFNKPFLTGNETTYIEDAVNSGHLAGNGKYTQKCQEFFENKYGFQKCFLTTSCTDALEMCALLINLKPGDEIILPGYTFVSTANAFVLRGAKLVFVDSCEDHPNMDISKVENLINSKTKAIVAVHYAGMACDMKLLMQIADKHKLFVIEDAAQAIDSYYFESPLGSFGHLSTFSFHETKNVMCGEGGMLVVNSKELVARSEIIWEKGTNRRAFFRGEVDKYTWVDLGSSFLPGEITAAFLYAQLENLELIQKKRVSIWNRYESELRDYLMQFNVNCITCTANSTNNGHLFYLELNNEKERNELIAYLKQKGIMAVFHYSSLNLSPFFQSTLSEDDHVELINSNRFSECLLRLPLFFNLSESEQTEIINSIKAFFKK